MLTVVPSTFSFLENKKQYGWLLVSTVYKLNATTVQKPERSSFKYDLDNVVDTLLLLSFVLV